jgi:hypothetical protein
MSQSKIFISYRRKDAAGYAYALWDRLRREFGDVAVFYDRNDKHHLPSGSDWESSIFNAIDNASACVIAIGPDWVNISDDKGQHRLEDPDDVVRKEVARALAKAEKNEIAIFPALFGQAGMPEKKDLPADLRGLPKWTARAYDMDFDTEVDFERLVDELSACPGVQRILISKVENEAFNKLKAFVAAGHLTKDQGDSLRVEMAKQMLLATIKLQGN